MYFRPGPALTRRRGLGDAESDATQAVAIDQTNDPALNAIRAISVPMGILRQQLNAEISALGNADASIDIGQLGADLSQMATYTNQLATQIQAFKQSAAYTADAQTAAQLDNWLAFAEAWLSSTAATVANLPSDLADYLEGQIQHVTTDALGATLPLIAGVALIAGLAIFGAKKAEGTRTYRKYVA